MTSLRRSQRKKHQPYGAGDLVEILVKKLLHKGLLLSKSIEELDVWNVKIEGEDKERQMNEELFGRIVRVGKNLPSSVGKQQKKTPSKPRGRPPKNKRGTSITRKRVGNTEGNERNYASSLERTSDEKSNTLSKDSSKSSKVRAKIIEKKKIGPGRRKKKTDIEDSVKKVFDSSRKENTLDTTKSDENTTEIEMIGSSRINTRSSSRKRNHTDIAPPLSFARKAGGKGRQTGRGGKRLRKMKGEEVEKVKFLTGTLYLYRGENPRVAFVRHY